MVRRISHDSESEDWERLAKLARERRIELNFTQTDVHLNGGPSGTTVRYIENRTNPRFTDSVLRALDAGLDWKPGSSHRIVYQGGDPEPIDEDARPMSAAESRIAELMRRKRVDLSEGDVVLMDGSVVALLGVISTKEGRSQADIVRDAVLEYVTNHMEPTPR